MYVFMCVCDVYVVCVGGTNGDMGGGWYHVSRSLLAPPPAHQYCVCWQECDTFQSRWTAYGKEGEEEE